MIGGLLYLITSRLNIMQVVCLVARYQANPKQSHDQAVKRIFRHMKVTPYYELWYKKEDDFTLKEYTNVDWAGCANDRRSTRDGAFLLEVRLVSLWCKKYDLVSLSIVEAKYTATSRFTQVM